MDIILLLRFVSASLFVGLTVLQLYRDWRWKDMRTKKFKRATTFILCLYLVPTIMQGFVMWDDYKSDKLSTKKIDNLVKGKDQIISTDTVQTILLENARDTISILKNNIDELIVGKNNLLELLKQKDERISELETKAIDAARGVSDTYDFNGAHRVTNGGSINVESGEQSKAFQEMQELIKQQNFKELIIRCNEQIKKAPRWNTPYLFLGAAYDDMGDKKNAIKYYKIVIEKTGSDPNYQLAKQRLKILTN